MDYAKWLNERQKRAQKEIFTEQVSVAPELARLILSKNPDNRNLRRAKMRQYVDDMKNGRWQFNGESVVIAKTGELNDGQHRMEAVVQSDTVQTFLLVFGVERDSRYTVDGGAARSAGDHLSLGGVSNSVAMASGARLILSYEKNNREGLGSPGDISSSAIVQRCKEDELLQECAQFNSGPNQRTMRSLAQPAVTVFVLYELSRIHKPEAWNFMTIVRDGLGIGKDNPIRLLRDKLIVGRRLSTNEKIELFFRTWNYWINDKELSVLPVTGRLPKLEKSKARQRKENTSAETEEEVPA